jgi:2'-5' RNA ligase superfamily
VTATAPPARTALQVDLPEARGVLAAVEGAGLTGVTLLRPAHVSLAYPWVDPPPLAALADAVAALALFPVRFAALRDWAAAGGRTLLYLEPEPPAPLAALAAALAFGATPSRPHLSVARVRPDRVAAVTALVTPLLPVDATVRTLQVRVRDAAGWRVAEELTLGG